MSVAFDKVRWGEEEVQRALEGEGLNEESRWVGDRYTTDAAEWERHMASLGPGQIILPHFPAINQLYDPSRDHEGQNLVNDCGPASTAMIIGHLTKVTMWVDDITDRMKGPYHTGYTNIRDIWLFLEEQAGIPSHIVEPGATPLRDVTRQWLSMYHPLIVLFYWKLEQPNSGHFCPIYGFDDGGVYRVNPWGGGYEHMTWRDFDRWEKGYAVLSQRTRYLT
jgi:hypothetical protein